MRKILLASAAILALGTGSTFAQTSSVTDYGVNDTVYVTQTNNSNSLTSASVTADAPYAPGYAYGAQVYVTQAGTGQTAATVYTVGGNGPGQPVTTVINQTNNGVAASYANVRQGYQVMNGIYGNAATINQNGVGDSATIYQGTDGSNLWLPGGYNMIGVNSTINQSGDNLSAFNQQTADGEYSLISQAVSNNQAQVLQSNAGALSYVYQNTLGGTGSNVALVYQTSGNPNVVSTINQHGNNGLAVVSQ